MSLFGKENFNEGRSLAQPFDKGLRRNGTVNALKHLDWDYAIALTPHLAIDSERAKKDPLSGSVRLTLGDHLCSIRLERKVIF